MRAGFVALNSLQTNEMLSRTFPTTSGEATRPPIQMTLTRKNGTSSRKSVQTCSTLFRKAHSTNTNPTGYVRPSGSRACALRVTRSRISHVLMRMFLLRGMLQMHVRGSLPIPLLMGPLCPRVEHHTAGSALYTTPSTTRSPTLCDIFPIKRKLYFACLFASMLQVWMARPRMNVLRVSCALHALLFVR